MRSVTKPSRFQSAAYALTAVGFGVPLIILGVGLCWLALGVAPPAVVAGGLLGGLGVRGVQMGLIGGVVLTEHEVVLRGWFAQRSVPRSSVTAIVLARSRASGQVSGVLRTASSRHNLSGMYAKHRHGLRLAEPCMECAEAIRLFNQLGSELGVPIEWEAQ